MELPNDRPWTHVSSRHNVTSRSADTVSFYRAYLYTVFGIAWLVIATSGLWFIAGLVSTLSGEGDIETETWSWTLGPLIVAFLALVGHYALYFKTERYAEMSRRFDAIPAPPLLGLPAAATAPAPAPRATAPAVASDIFCRVCGAELRRGDVFCAKCGGRLAPA